MIKKISALVFLALLNVGFLYAQEFDWVQKIEIKRGDSDSPFPSLDLWGLEALTEADPTGNIFMAGSFKDTLVFGTNKIFSKSGFDFFIAKYDASGSVQWIKQFEGINDQVIADMDIDRNGNIYLTGVFTDELKFGSNVVSGSGAFVVKLDNAGTLTMTKTMEGVQTIYPKRIIAHEYGQFFLAGSLHGTVNFGCSSLTADQTGTKFISYYNANGDCQWTNKFVASYLNGLAFDGYYLYMTGGFVGDATFGDVTITADFQDIYVAKCGMRGEWAWAFGVGGAEEDQATDVEIDHSGNVIVTGFFAGSVDFGTQSLTSTGANDMFIASYDPYMSLNWLQQAGGGVGNQYSFDIDISAAEELIVTGSIIDETHFGNHTLVPNGEKSYFAAYDADGTALWALGTTGSSGDRGLDITTSHSDTYITGTFFSTGEYVFSSHTIQANAGEVYLAKIKHASERFTRIVPNDAVNVQYSHNAWVDFDGDNDLDFVTTGANSTNDLRTILYENTGGDEFRPAGHPFNLPQYSESEIAFVNLNHDDRIDLMFMGRRIGNENTNRISLIENNEDGFIDTGSLPDFGSADGYGTISTGDVNGDGFQDIFVSGTIGYNNGNSLLGAFLYVNKNGTFTKTESTALTGLYIAASRFADLDNDQDLDLIVSGSDGEYPYQNTLVYLNDGTGTFSLSTIQLIQLQNPSIDVSDMDGDHDLDLLLTGLDGQLKPITKLYRNTSGAFDEVQLPASMNRTASGSAKWGDYDNDGDVDILITGGAGASLSIFLNDAGVFTELLDPAFENLGIGHASWGDYDADGDLDILATGSTYFDNEHVPALYILRNEMTTKNESPATPDNFSITPDNTSVVLNWDPSADDITPSSSLTYNISVRNMNTDEYLLHPFSEKITGQRMIAEHGNVMLNNSWQLNALEPGTYSIQVQAIDGGYRGSPWTAEKIFYAGPLEAPDNLTADYDDGQILLSWSDNSVNEESFVIERMTNDGEFTRYDSVSADVNTFIDATDDIGSYSYRVYAVNPLLKTSYTNTAEVLITGVEFSARNSAQLYPNPAVNTVSVSVKALTDRSASLQIRDTHGMLVASEHVVFEGNGEAQVDIGSLAPGIYFVQLNSAGASRMMKLIKK